MFELVNAFIYKRIQTWLFFSFLLLSLFLNVNKLFAQIPIPSGISLDTIYVKDFLSKLSYQTFHLYKPSNYDPLTSPIMIVAHGSGGNGATVIANIDSLAYRRKALIIAPNFAGNSGGYWTILRHQEPVAVQVDTINSCSLLRPASLVIKQIYEHVLLRENRTNVPCYMIGFSAGGQWVSRYMLIRQAYPDSIPIKMAVSSSAYFYAFPTDTFMGVPMRWLCGLIMPLPDIGSCPQTFNIYNWDCDEHIIQYYNENYAVMVGSADLQVFSDGNCLMAQGNTRLQRAQTFYNFCDSNAVNRGTALQWPYVEIPGVGHNEYGIYNTYANAGDTSTIAETLLFDTPYHPVPFTAPVAAFYADTTQIQINGTVNFINTSINATNYLWDFGDGSTSTLPNPSHVYTTIDTFRVQLTAYNNTGCWNWTERRHYIKIVNPVSVKTINSSGLQINAYPNPVSDKLKVQVKGETQKKLKLILSDISGRRLNSYSFSETVIINTGNISPGIYFYEIYEGNNFLGAGKFMKE